MPRAHPQRVPELGVRLQAQVRRVLRADLDAHVVGPRVQVRTDPACHRPGVALDHHGVEQTVAPAAGDVLV
jgi:hypothetical protein